MISISTVVVFFKKKKKIGIQLKMKICKSIILFHLHKQKHQSERKRLVHTHLSHSDCYHCRKKFQNTKDFEFNR